MLNNIPVKATPCYDQVINLLRSLSDKDLSSITDHYMQSTDLSIQGQIVDSLAAVQTNHSQTLITHYILEAAKPNGDFIMRALMHFIELEKAPSQVFYHNLLVLVLYQHPNTS